MATKTYLQLVNDVLVRLREEEVDSVTDTAYSTLVGVWVNDAKRMVENAWDWQVLSTAVSVSIAVGTRDYTLASLNERARLQRDVERPHLPLAFDVTSGDPFQLIDRPLDWVRKERNLQTVANSQPTPIYFATAKTAGGVAIALFETPTATRDWLLYFTDPQDDLSADADVLSVPFEPVVQITLDYALNERGEEIGEPGNTVAQKAKMHIADAIAIDAQDQPHKTTFYPG